MKEKMIQIVFTSLLMIAAFAFSAFAKNGLVTLETVSADGTGIMVSGIVTPDNGGAAPVAVMVRVKDADGETAVMESLLLDLSGVMFSGTIPGEFAEGAVYQVTAADFDGGKWSEPVEVTIPVSPTPAPVSGGSYSVSTATMNVADKTGAVEGTWTFTAAGTWEFSYNGKKAVSEWVKAWNHSAAGGAQVQWFWFDANGTMLTGWQWITDQDGVRRCYYLNPVSNGSLGACYLGGYTPDGWRVDKNGAWDGKPLRVL